MSDKERHHPIKKYLTAKQFIDYCKVNRVDASPHLLEIYEKYCLLFPVYRLIVPERYIKATFEYRKRRLKDPSIPSFECCGDWKPIEHLFSILDSYRISDIAVLEGALKNGHPLDNAFKNRNPFLKKPAQLDFVPWQDYRTTVGCEEGQPVKENLAEHYYMPCQLFVINDLNRMHTIEVNYLTNHQKSYDCLRKKIHQSKILEFSDIFQTVSDYRMLEAVILSIIADKLETNIIEGDAHENFIKRRGEIAKNEYMKHSQKNWIKFVRKLIVLYDDYLKHEKQHLSQELRRFLKSTVEMIILARDTDFEQLCNEYSNGYTGWGISIIDNIEVYSKGLEEIFPIETKQLKERALKVLPFYFNSFSKILPNKIRLPNNSVEQLVLTLIDEGNELTLTHLHEIENLWSNRILHWTGSIWAHLRSFAISVETVGKEWHDGHDMRSMLNNVFENYSTIKDKSITNAQNPNEFMGKLGKVLTERGINDNLFGYHIIITHLFRNFSSHYNKKIESRMLGSKFLSIYECLIFTLITLFVKYKKKKTAESSSKG